MQHWDRGMYGERLLVNPSAKTAVREAGTNALPFLMRWMKRPVRRSTDVNYPSWALHGFEVLGPSAKSAIPELIALLGEKGSGNDPSFALAYIGRDAVPALTNLLGTNQNWRARSSACQALTFMGTNAESALPCLLTCLKYAATRQDGRIAIVLAEVGRNQPEVVVPVLVAALTKSTGYEAAAIADALATFDSAAKDAVPGLLAAGTSRDPYVRTRIAAALQRIAPETPDALQPLMRNLRAGSTMVRQQALWALEQLGTNGAPALPVLVSRSLRDPVPEVRVIALRCVGKIGLIDDAVLAGISENVSNSNYFVAKQAVETLAKFAVRSQGAFVALLRAKARSPVSEARGEAGTQLELISHQDPTFLVQCLAQADPLLRCCAMKVLCAMEVRIPAAVPPLVKALQDADPDVRAAATNCLIRVDSCAAKQAGVKVPFPYSDTD
jgi:HEAT repeat protein